MGCCSSEPVDKWNITDEIQSGELGAGYLNKREIGSLTWSQRYFVLTDSKLIYYLENNRNVVKGEITLAAAIARENTAKDAEKKEYHFSISHPQCGMRELYAKSKERRAQWISQINSVAESLAGSHMFGKLLKQGGLNKSVWQERWCVVAGKQLSYFDTASDNLAKGSIDLVNAKIREISTKDYKYCFEISSQYPTKKDKKYVFAVPDDDEAEKWLSAVYQASATVRDTLIANTTKSTTESKVTIESKSVTTMNPILSANVKESSGLTSKESSSSASKVASTPISVSANVAAKPVSIEIVSVSSVTTSEPRPSTNAKENPILRPPSTHERQTSMNKVTSPKSEVIQANSRNSSESLSRDTEYSRSSEQSAPRASAASIAEPPMKSGYLDKLSPKRLVGYQKRYIVLKSPGILAYYGSETESKGESKGTIALTEALPGSLGVKYVEGKSELIINMENRSFTFRASSPELASEWVKAIKAWISFINSSA